MITKNKVPRPSESFAQIALKTCITVNVLKFRIFLFLFSNKLLVFRVGIHKRLVRIVNREDPKEAI